MNETTINVTNENDNYLKYVSILNMQEYIDDVIKEVETLKDNPNNHFALATKSSLVACLANHKSKESSYNEAMNLINKAIEIIGTDENELSSLMGYEAEIRTHFFFMDASEIEKSLFKLLNKARGLNKNNEKDILNLCEKLLEINPKNTMVWLVKASSTVYLAASEPLNVISAYNDVMSYLDAAIATDSSWTRIIENNRKWFKERFIFLGYKEGLEEKVKIQEPQKESYVSNNKNTVAPIIITLIFFALFIQFLSNSTPKYETKEVKENKVEKPLEVKNDNTTVNVSALTKNWNNAHSSKDVTFLANLFDKSVLFYGASKDKNFCLENKLKLFNKSPDFHQEIDDIKIEKQFDGTVKSSFVKRVTINKKTKDYPSYLIFKNIEDNWKIIAEGDVITDKNLAKNTEPKKEIIETVSSVPTVSSDVHQSSYNDRSDSLENMAALSAAPLLCGFKVNKSMVTISMTALFPNPSDLNRGGRYWNEFERNLDRIEMLASTESGKQSFCNSIKRKLSAFFD